MKLLYIGSICDNYHFIQTVNRSKIKPSAAPQNFESAILKGLSSYEDVELECLSLESIATYPNGYKLYLERRKDKLINNIETHIIPAINLPFIKPYMHSKGVAVEVKNWMLRNEGTSNKCVFIYGFYATVFKEIINLCNHYKCKCFIMVTDLPSITLTEYKGIKGYLKAREKKYAMDIIGRADGYVYITKQMADAIAPQKPYHIMEVLVDTDILPNKLECKKQRALMYAGTLYKKYGIDMLLNIYEKLNTDYELWIMGAGDYEAEIKERAQRNPNIKFFGVLSREEILSREQQATLLINVRNPEDEYTKYSFPSKMIEYMLSGTPVITTKLPGFPQEYDEHLFYCENYELEDMVNTFRRVLNLPSEELVQKGCAASEFVKKQKNCIRQMGKVIDFIKTQL